ncbi:MAG TPA: SRPBCC domain-containing protein [Polyangiales bacterium]|nr:SRPBCC domain-containing protein [Polyangiales bacterium]
MSTETVRVVRRFQASAERVFDAWLDPAQAAKFLFATPHGSMQSVELDRAGFRIIERRDDQDFEHVGRFTTLERPRVLAFAFAAGLAGSLGPESAVRIELLPLVSGCEVTLAHEGVPSEFVVQGENSWAQMLANLDHNVRPDT